MRIVCDAHIPFLLEAVQKGWPQVEIVPLKPEEIDTSAVRDADVLVVRTRTKINEALLAGSKVQLVCTATIGYDHIDAAYCDAQGIRWMSCPGCNAQAVCDYIEEVLVETISNFKFQISNSPTIGVVGVGHVGSLVAKMAERKGMKVLLNDPPKGIGESLDFIGQKCDIITFHVPLDTSTKHMCDEVFLAKCKSLSKKGRFGYSKLLWAMSNNASFDPSLDWLSYSKENIKNYLDDLLCGFKFTNFSNKVLFELTQNLHKKKRYQVKNPTLRIYSISGEDDRTTGGEKGLKDTLKSLLLAGYIDMKYKTYPNMKHEILMEENHQEVIDDILKFFGE